MAQEHSQGTSTPYTILGIDWHPTTARPTGLPCKAAVVRTAFPLQLHNPSVNIYQLLTRGEPNASRRRVAYNFTKLLPRRNCGWLIMPSAGLTKELQPPRRSNLLRHDYNAMESMLLIYLAIDTKCDGPASPTASCQESICFSNDMQITNYPRRCRGCIPELVRT